MGYCSARLPELPVARETLGQRSGRKCGGRGTWDWCKKRWRWKATEGDYLPWRGAGFWSDNRVKYQRFPISALWTGCWSGSGHV